MSNKRTPLQFSDLMSIGLSSIFIGIGSLTFYFSKPLVSILLGLVSIIFGIVSLRYSEHEKLERWSAWLGIVLSVASIICVIFSIYR